MRRSLTVQPRPERTSVVTHDVILVQRGVVSSDAVNLYDNVYADFTSQAERAVRQETYGEDLGQSSWLTVREWLAFADHLGLGPESELLEVGSGSGGPAIYLAAQRGC